MTPDFAANYNRALKYSHGDARLMLAEMATDPDHLKPNSNLRAVAADALDDEGKHDIAAHMRGPFPLAVDHKGRVLPATIKLHRMLAAMRRYHGGEHLMEQGDSGPTELRLEAAKELDRLGRNHEAQILRSRHPTDTHGGTRVTGDYPRYGWPGGGEIVYPTSDGNDVFCHNCRNGENGSKSLDPEYADDIQWQTNRNGFVHEEGSPIQCAHCNREIPSLHGDPDQPDEDQ